MRGSALLPERFRENVVCACFRSGVVRPTPEEVAMTTPPRTRRGHSLVYLIAGALAVGALIAIAVVMPRRSRAEDSAHAAPQAGAADRCSIIPPDAGHPPVELIPVTLQLVQRSIEPVPVTDGLIHLAYAAQVTNTRTTPADITGVVPLDPLADFSPTGRNFVTDDQGRDVTGAVRLFATPPNDTLPVDGPQAGPVPGFFTRVPAGNSGLMFFDVTYTDTVQIPRLLGHAITVTTPPAADRKLNSPTRWLLAAERQPFCIRPWSGMAGLPGTAAAPL
jgi:hypothetical protein